MKRLTPCTASVKRLKATEKKLRIEVDRRRFPEEDDQRGDIMKDALSCPLSLFSSTLYLSFGSIVHRFERMTLSILENKRHRHS
jgi:hypothetical protein